MPSKVWDEITYTFLNFNGATVDVYECVSNFIPYFIMDVITYPWIKSILAHSRSSCHQTVQGIQGPFQYQFKSIDGENVQHAVVMNC